MRKLYLLNKQECIWLRDLIDKEIARVTEAFIEANGHPVLRIRLENLEAMKVKLNNQINNYLKKVRTGDDK